MTFALTKYIFPIEKEIDFSIFRNYKFDNPRTNAELKIVKDFISETIREDIEESEALKITPIVSHLGFSLHNLREHLTKTGTNAYALEYFKSSITKEYIDILAESWIIIRLPEQKEFQQISEDKSELHKHMLTRNESNYSLSYKELSNYCYLASLLTHDNDEYYGESFLLSDNPYEIFFSASNLRVLDSISKFHNNNSSLEHTDRQTNWLYWLDSCQSLILSSKSIDSLMMQDANTEKKKKTSQSQKQTPKQKLLHFGNLLQTSYQHLSDPGLMLLLLVSGIEYLITRNPDSTRFNVEDSISKQFNLKCAVLIHSQDNNYDLIKLNQELKEIYSQRSDFAHGNFQENYNIDEIIKSVYLLYRFNRNIINSFINDRQLLEYLKDN